MLDVEGLIWMLKKKGFQNCFAFTSKPRNKVAPASHAADDWADLSELEFQRALQTLTLPELEGMANRRRHLQAPELRSWSEVQRNAILARKYELERSK